MEAQCPSCKARYRVKLETVPEAGLKVVCPKCKSPFFINPESQSEKEPPPQQDSFVLETVAEPNQGPTPVQPMSGKGGWVGWILGVMFSFAGLGMLFQYHFLSALFYFIAAIVLIPPLACKLKFPSSAKFKAVVVIGCVLGAVFTVDLYTKKVSSPPLAQRIATEKPATKPRENVSNSSWDGSVYQVEQYLKHNLKDPKSFEAIEWSPVQKVELDSHKYIVRCKYRAKNSLGGYVIEEKIFYLSKEGSVIGVRDFGK